MMKSFEVGDFVERKNHGDLPCMVIRRFTRMGVPSRYDLEAVNGTKYRNIPEYLLVKARPAKQSRWGLKCVSYS